MTSQGPGRWFNSKRFWMAAKCKEQACGTERGQEVGDVEEFMKE